VPPAPSPTSTADRTRQYIDEHPSIREALLEDLVNYTALARRIQAELGLRNEEAVTVACRRYQRNLLTPTAEGAAVRAILAASRLEVHSRVAVLRIRDDSEVLEHLYELGRRLFPAPPTHRMFQLFQGTRATTLLCDEDYLVGLLAEIPDRLLMGVERGLASLVLRSRREVSETPGVLSYLVDALYRRGINTLETVSVHDASIFVFRDQDVLPAFQVLSNLVAPATGR
jgi:hypothetical protein